MVLTKQAEAVIPTELGDLRLVAFATDDKNMMPHLAIIHDPIDQGPVLVRMHSECLTGDLIGSKRCDCGEQLQYALESISKTGGVIIYLRQEGRGIGLINKLRAYNLQDNGMDTYEANVHLGFEPDERSYELAIEMLENLGIREIKLLTNNPHKVSAFDSSKIQLIERVPIEIDSNEMNRSYLKAKRSFGHFLSIL
jgi:GTP cyclohydrolase II